MEMYQVCLCHGHRAGDSNRCKQVTTTDNQSVCDDQFDIGYSIDYLRFKRITKLRSPSLDKRQRHQKRMERILDPKLKSLHQLIRDIDAFASTQHILRGQKRWKLQHLELFQPNRPQSGLEKTSGLRPGWIRSVRHVAFKPKLNGTRQINNDGGQVHRWSKHDILPRGSWLRLDGIAYHLAPALSMHGV